MAAAEDFIVLGDLRGTFYDGGPRLDAGTFVVRMFVGDGTYDEEITCPLGELRANVEKRMRALAKKPDAKLRVDAERPHPALDNGHAVEVP